MTHRWNAAMSAACAIAVTIAAISSLASSTAHAADPIEIVIERGGVKPDVLRTAIDRTVVFVNRSGKPIDVSFLGYRGMHHVSETSGQLTAVFHRAGRHPYVVTFGNSYEGHLHGSVEVDPDPSHRQETPVCTGVSVRYICMEP